MNKIHTFVNLVLVFTDAFDQGPTTYRLCYQYQAMSLFNFDLPCHFPTLTVFGSLPRHISCTMKYETRAILFNYIKAQLKILKTIPNDYYLFPHKPHSKYRLDLIKT